MIRAAIFDLDGLLLDSEPLWQDAEIEIFPSVGHPLTRADCARTKGLRIDEVVRHWYAVRPWPQPAHEELARRICARVEELVRDRGRAMPGAIAAISLARDLGLKVAVASSSSAQLIGAALERLGISGLDAVRSAEAETHGKPHPAVLLSTAAELGVEARACVVIEDSIFGVVAAKAARMRCVAVPDPSEAADPRFSLADVTLASLEQLDRAGLGL